MEEGESGGFGKYDRMATVHKYGVTRDHAERSMSGGFLSRCSRLTVLSLPIVS